MIRHGYCCINMQLGEQGIRTGRTMIDKKFRQGGMQLASDISLACLLYTSPSPRDRQKSRMPSSA